ncbi:extensin [Streptomyces venezuelae]|uniref:extensin n=1 Tax=Streptomyces venezuelae TaxID=54571 RepID=UPI001238E84A|nr:extensin [Streptomyces venezuelae]
MTGAGGHLPGPVQGSPLPIGTQTAQPAPTVLPVQRFPATPPLPLPPPPVVRTAPAPPPVPPPVPRTVQRAPEPKTPQLRSQSPPQPREQRPQHDPDPAPSRAHPRVTDGAFSPRSLTDFQLDELAHRLIGRITRQLRTELRLDRERVGRLRDPRN